MLRVARTSLASLASVLLLLALAGAAQAVVVDPAAIGQTSIAYPAGQGSYVGVAMVPGTRSDLSAASVPTVSSGGGCSDPWLTSDLLPPSGGLCWHGGSVVHKSETFALTWDQHRAYWSGARNFVEQFLRDVADGSGTLTSPFAITGQYRDGSGLAANLSVYGGGCIDYGVVGGSACQLGAASGNGAGHDFPTSGCPVTSPATSANTDCLTDAQLRTEVATMASQTGMLGKLKPGFQPVVDLLLPSGVEACLDAAGTLCSANSNASARFCSYHSTVTVGSANIAYVVQPWSIYAGCDEPGVPDLPNPATAQQISVDAGLRLVSPLSQGQLGAITDPRLNGWFALDGSEIGDNGCVPLPKQLDQVTVGSSDQNPYWLQREFNNAGVIETEPFAPACAPSVTLQPAFVVPSAVNAGDQLQLDGSATASTLIVPSLGYFWNFGDGTAARGPSVLHSYRSGGRYSVTLTVADRGGNVRSLTQTIDVLATGGKPVTPPAKKGSRALRAHVQLLPQGLNGMLRRGVAMRVTANQRADGFVVLAIPRTAARRAGLRTGHGTSVVIGRGTVSGITNGTVGLHLHVAGPMAAKLKRVRHLTLTVRLSLVAQGGSRLTIDVAGRY